MRVDERVRSEGVLAGGAGALWGRVSSVVAASDPGLSRLRTAAMTLAALLVVAGVLVGAAILLEQPVTGALPGVVVAMIATIALKDPTPGRGCGGRGVRPAAGAAGPGGSPGPAGRLRGVSDAGSADPGGPDRR